jgi:hypothetical protein
LCRLAAGRLGYPPGQRRSQLSADPLGGVVMGLPVSLQSGVDEMGVMNDEWVAYINRRTGQLVTITDYDREESTEALQAEDSPDFIPLPSKFDVDEYSIMERFCESVSDSTLAHELSSVIRGSGAFRRFKAAIRRSGVEDGWFAFRQQALESIAVAFLDAHGIPYKRV